MPLNANEQSTEVGRVTGYETLVDICENPMKLEDGANEDGEEEEEEDEEEDVDFNPFLKETPSPEASSSLSSEIVGDSEHGEEEIATQATVSPKGVSEEGSKCSKDVTQKTKKRKSILTSQSEVETVRKKENGSASSGIDVNDCIIGDLSNTTDLQKPIIDLDNEDAICRRTRARYSLTSFSLDELEAFLQETDDDDDLQNVDDEEEYRKFLAAVLQGGDGDGQSTQENENIDDEDEEDNDADFEIELEEMLDSDYDEGIADKTRKEALVRDKRRPETRQNRRQKASAQYRKKLIEQSKRPLRPLLPILPNGPPIAPFPILDGKTLMPETAQSCLSSRAEDGLINGFTPHQIGQLYCLIHEHVQLLVQVFSLCVLDPSRQHIASQVQGLIFELLHKRDEAIAFRNEAYPDVYFSPPYTCSSVPDELPQLCLEQSNFDSSSSFDSPGVDSPNVQTVFQNIFTTQGRCDRVLNGQEGSVQTVKGCFWLPLTSGSVLSVLDVAPLNLVGKFIDDVFTSVEEYRRRRLASSSDICFEREPLFPFPPFTSSVEANGEVSKGKFLPATNTVASSPSQPPPKRSLAATLVESTKKQSVALVPKEISTLAQRFFPLFNPSLFPHKPPPAAVANRVLFTDAEDELLALGIMEYNTDWKAIQQRFLPCKLKHQIFVRQKNRCSSKAPENPIKAVRRMKTSPLTPKEIECIQEGLKVFKLDWMSVWKFVVPHRDPTLLRRQWRIALGTQKCYKQDAAKKEKRRLYEFKRRCKTADLANWHLDSDREGENAGGDINSTDSYIENAIEGYVHEAFLADWRPSTYNNGSSGNPCVREKHITGGTLSRGGTSIGEDPNRASNMLEFPFASNESQHQYPLSQLAHVRQGVSNTVQPNHPVPKMASKTCKSQACLPPYRARRSNNAHLVKLAPDLPPVNLPPSVRVIPQSAFKSVQCGSSAKVSANGSCLSHSGQETAVPLLSHPAKYETSHLVTTGRDKRDPLKENVANSRFEESHVTEEERGTDSDLQMHPLLFQAPEDGHLPYYPLNCRTSTSSSFSFFSGNQPQLNLSLFHNPRQVSHIVNCFNKSVKTKESTSGSCVIGFHPLLKRTVDGNNDSVMVPSNACLSVGLESKSDQCKIPFDAVPSKYPVNQGPFATGSVSSSSNEKVNELDLEIHLSSSSAQERSLGSRDMTASNPMLLTAVVNSGDREETQNTNSIYYQYGENCGQVVSNAHFSVPSTSNIDEIGDNSHPEVVMEQEELSDSDEEIEEHVEFECEEMTDSEGEDGSGCDQIAEMQDKEVSGLLTERVTDGDSDDQQRKLTSPPLAQGGASAPRKSGSPFLKLGLTNLGKDTTSSSWLSLNSCAGHPTFTKSNNVDGRVSEGGPTFAKNTAYRPNRSCKKTTPSAKRVTTQTHTSDTAQQLSPSPLAGQIARKPRKRGSRTNTSLNIATTDNKDKLG